VTGVDHRPGFHVSPGSGWLNDPAGPFVRNGRYHLFFQHNPAEPVWDRMCWAHVSSDDLVRWDRLPNALEPTPGGPDADGCWTGCTVDDGGVPTIVYSGHLEGSPLESVCLARGSDDLLRWRKDGRSPVLSGAPAGLECVGLRDPCVRRDEDGWELLLGAGLAGRGGAVLRYRSADLVEWEFAGVVVCRALGRVWECPQLFALEKRHVLIASVWDGEPRHTVAFVGEYRDGRFTPESVARFDHGLEYYAPSTLPDEEGRRLVWGWSREARDEAAAREQGWAGALTLPRVLSLRPDGRLGVSPPAELESLRGVHERLEGRTPLRPEPRGNRLELRVAAGAASRIGLDLASSPDGEERTTIAWDRASGNLSLDRSRSSLDPRARGGILGGPLQLAADEELDLRVFLDASIVEVFANGRLALTARIYPTRPDSTGIVLRTSGGDPALSGLDVWQLGDAEAR
jgi:beta-fructofuranosidase